MNLEEFKKQLSSEATEENESLHAKIRDLEEEIVNLSNELDEAEDSRATAESDLRTMFNRCQISACGTSRAICMYCGFIIKCRGTEEAVSIMEDRKFIEKIQ